MFDGLMDALKEIMLHGEFLSNMPSVMRLDQNPKHEPLFSTGLILALSPGLPRTPPKKFIRAGKAWLARMIQWYCGYNKTLCA